MQRAGKVVNACGKRGAGKREVLVGRRKRGKVRKGGVQAGLL